MTIIEHSQARSTTGEGDAIASNVQTEWDAALLRLNGHLLQSWKWGEFKSRHGWSVERVSVGSPDPSGMAQILFRSRGPVSIGYIPRGPALGPSEAHATELIAKIDQVSRRRRALYLIAEADGDAEGQRLMEAGYRPGGDPIQPARTVKVPLLPDDELLKQMHQKTRYSVRLAQRRGVTVHRAAPNDRADIRRFYDLLTDTAERNEFGIHSYDYYESFLDVFGDDAVLLLGMIDGHAAAGLIAARFGREAIYMYGGSSSVHRAHGAAFYLQFEAMRWARDAGSTHYDLWGIPVTDPPKLGNTNDSVAPTKGEDWRGLYRFKTGFGGYTQLYPPPLERTYVPVMSTVAKRFITSRA